MCSDTRKVSDHWREKYGQKAEFCSGEGMNGRMNQSLHSAWPCSSEACLRKNSCVFSKLPFWKRNQKKGREKRKKFCRYAFIIHATA